MSFRVLIMLVTVLCACSDGGTNETPKTMASVLQSSATADWREPDPDNTIYMLLDRGTVVFELAPEFAPNTVGNIRSLVKARYFDGLTINRAQENYVVQWGDAAAGSNGRRAHEVGDTLNAEFFRRSEGLQITALDSLDAYADVVGFTAGFPVGSDGTRAWLMHCYSMLGVGRDTAHDSGNGTELYVVIGHAPRHLDRNVTLVGRVIHGMSHLSTLPRGTGPLGFYETDHERIPIRAMRIASDIPESQRLPLEILRTDTETFRQLVEARQFRLEEWFADPAGRIGICNVPIPVRLTDAAS